MWAYPVYCANQVPSRRTHLLRLSGHVVRIDDSRLANAVQLKSGQRPAGRPMKPFKDVLKSVQHRPDNFGDGRTSDIFVAPNLLCRRFRV